MYMDWETRYKKVKSSLKKKSAANRIFFDGLIMIVCVECKASEFDDRSWCYMLIPSYKRYSDKNSKRKAIGNKRVEDYKCAARMLTPYEIYTLNHFIYYNKGVKTLLDFQKRAAVLFDECMLSAINIMNVTFNTND